MSNTTTMTSDRFIAAFLSGLSEEGLNHGLKIDRHAEYRRDYPKASDAEIQMLCDAGSKNVRSMPSLPVCQRYCWRPDDATVPKKKMARTLWRERGGTTRA
jgi:hypothetical protein